jgi:hypothetical protein
MTYFGIPGPGKKRKRLPRNSKTDASKQNEKPTLNKFLYILKPYRLNVIYHKTTQTAKLLLADC